MEVSSLTLPARTLASKAHHRDFTAPAGTASPAVTDVPCQPHTQPIPACNSVGRATGRPTRRRLNIPNTFAGLWEKDANRRQRQPYQGDGIVNHHDQHDLANRENRPLDVKEEQNLLSTTQPGKLNRVFPYPRVPSGKEQGQGSFKHRSFSFELSPPDSPELTVTPNKGGLMLDMLDLANTINTVPAGYGGVGGHCHVRSTSSTYSGISQGIRTPEMTVSPPMTFGRRILSSLESYGFARGRLPSFLKSSESGDESAQNPFVDTVSAQSSEDTTTVKTGVIASGYEGRPRVVSEVTASQDTLYADGSSGSDLERVEARTDITMLDTNMDAARNQQEDGGEWENTNMVSPTDTEYTAETLLKNLSTQCLPRVSTNLDRETSSVSYDDDNNKYIGPGLRSRTQSGWSWPGIKHGLKSGLNKGLYPVKVKKWFTRQFRVGKRGTKVIMGKVRERKARLARARHTRVVMARKQKTPVRGTSVEEVKGITGIKLDEGARERDRSVVRSIRLLGAKLSFLGLGPEQNKNQGQKQGEGQTQGRQDEIGQQDRMEQDEVAAVDA
ncbi:hypothetical protein QBC46DRAFT_337180 [Diplogelasinospora grovesii]|uniref:Uncharacterized protein n=1 Tax=Diplogelasinospora grovesii TaxID=303347 RepID=A0AAN6S8Y7_9PEZI|nr:hypothetical protein QBC46DRAFT_337180 [Diplogelasinospora grovesii]